MGGVRMRRRFVGIVLLRGCADSDVGSDCIHCRFRGVCCELHYFECWNISSDPQDSIRCLIQYLCEPPFWLNSMGLWRTTLGVRSERSLWHNASVSTLLINTWTHRTQPIKSAEITSRDNPGLQTSLKPYQASSSASNEPFSRLGNNLQVRLS
jgi:hypothetical protein